MKMQGNAHLHKLLACFLFFCTWKESSALNMALLSQNLDTHTCNTCLFLIWPVNIIKNFSESSARERTHTRGFSEDCPLALFALYSLCVFA